MDWVDGFWAGIISVSRLYSPEKDLFDKISAFGAGASALAALISVGVAVWAIAETRRARHVAQKFELAKECMRIGTEVNADLEWVSDALAIKKVLRAGAEGEKRLQGPLNDMQAWQDKIIAAHEEIAAAVTRAIEKPSDEGIWALQALILLKDQEIAEWWEDWGSSLKLLGGPTRIPRSSRAAIKYNHS